MRSTRTAVLVVLGVLPIAEGAKWSLGEQPSAVMPPSADVTPSSYMSISPEGVTEGDVTSVDVKTEKSDNSKADNSFFALPAGSTR